MNNPCNTEKKAVLFVSNIPSPYNIDYLNMLGERRPVTAVFERGHASNRDGSWKQLQVRNFSCHILKGIPKGRDAAFSPGVLRYIHRHRKDHIVIGNPATPTGILAILYCKLFRIPFILQSEGGIAGSGKGLKERVKYFLMHDARLYLSGMSLKNEYFLTYGATPDRVKQYPFASFFDRDILLCPLSAEEKRALRAQLGITEEKVILAVGQIIYRKAHDILLAAAKKLPDNVGIYIVGGKATPELQAIVDAHELRNVHFVEFVPKERLWDYYKMADILAVPTREDTWGLFVNEAMANGLPVITTKRCVAGVELIEDGENGYLIDVDDTAALTDRVNRLLADDALRNKMAANNLQKISGYTFEEQARIIDEALTGAES